MIYTVTFNPSLDYTIHVENFELGKVNRTVQEDIYAGGKGINVSMVLKGKVDKDVIRNELSRLVDEECIDKPCTQLSGGMKRRVEIVRAMMADSDVVIMDEPFAGLDDKTKDTVIHYIINNIRERVLIISTHDDEDVKKLSAKVLFIDNKVANCYNNV